MTAADLCEAAGVTYRQLDYWCTAGLIPRRAQPGSGNWRQFTREEARFVVRLALLVRAGIRPHVAAAALRAQKNGNPRHLSLPGGVEVRLPSHVRAVTKTA